MEVKIFLTVFVTVFIAELGDKTQLATLLFATDSDVGKLTVFLAASAALIASSAIAVLIGYSMSHIINEKFLQTLAGILFVGIGLVTLYSAQTH